MTQPETRRRCKLSAIVVSYNREEIIGTVLRGLQFADEVILLDKSFTDRTAEIGAAFVDRVVRVPWSPTVEETRVSMESYCTPQDSPHISNVISMRYSGVLGDHFRFPPNCPRCPPWACQPRRRSATTGRIVKSRGWSGPSNRQIKNEGSHKI